MRTWLLQTIDSVARNAHKYLRIPEPWRPTTTIVTDGVVSADPLKLLDGYRGECMGLWDGADADVGQEGAHIAQTRPTANRPDAALMER